MKKINLKQLKQWDKVEINWLDAVKNTGGWSSLDDFNWKSHYNAMPHNIIGYYINECVDGITVCHAYAVDNNYSFDGAFTIPKGCILGIKKLK